MLFIGVDVGTTNIKCAIFDEHGQLVAERAKPNRAAKNLGWDSLDVGVLVSSVKNLLREVIEAVGENRTKIRGIGFASMGETVIPIDGAKAIFDGIYWYETCTRPQFEKFCAQIDPKSVHKLTALNPSWIYSVSKIMKVRDDYPEIYEKATAFLDVSGFMAFLLSGAVGFDSTNACRTMLLDVQNRRWSEALVSAAGLDMAKLPPLRDPGEAWGTLKKEFANELGLDENVVITTGGQDHIAAAFSAGVNGDEQAVISIGTSAAFYTPADKRCYLNDDFLKRFYLAGGYSAFKDGAYVLTGMSAGGFCIDWFIHRVLGRDYSMLDKMELQETKAIFLPNLRAQMGGFPSGGFTDLTDIDTGETLLQSIMESLSFECRYTLEEAFKAKGAARKASELIMVGGGARNSLFMQILSLVMQSPIKIHSAPFSAAAKGASMSAAEACGVKIEIREQCEIYENYKNNPKFAKYLDEKYARYIAVFRCNA